MTGAGTKLAYSIPEAAAAVGVSPNFMRAMCLDGRVRSVKLGRRLVVPAAALDDLMAAKRPHSR